MSHGLYLRINKQASLEIPDGMTYEQALNYANACDSAGDLEFDLHIDVMDMAGEVVNEAGWEDKS